MKCPKCGYLGFEHVDRCRNCGYDFSLASPVSLPELPMRRGAENDTPLEDLRLKDVVPGPPSPGGARGVARRPPLEGTLPASPHELPLFGDSMLAGDAPLITKASPPRPPLSVRRATPEVPKLRSPVPLPMLDLPLESLQRPVVSTTARAQLETRPEAGDTSVELEPATLSARGLAVGIDLLVLAAIDVVVIYFTLQICGLNVGDFSVLPKGPLVAFLLAQNGAYLVAFTAGGQTLGKMAVGIKVVPAPSHGPLDLGRSILRTLVWMMLALPAGLGLLTAAVGPDRRGLHDWCAGTRVVRV